jgi:hypothetical protein
MMSKRLGSRLAALGAGVAMAATMVTGLLAAPAAATAGTAVSAKPKVSVSTPKATPKNHEGRCPATVTFTSKVTVRPTASKTRVVYRWLHSGGTKGKLKSYTLKGKSAKTITVKESTTFKRDTKGWRALQVLSPRKVTSKKGAFSVDCHKPSPPKQWVRASVDVDRYARCYSEVDATGYIRVGKPTWVKYRWVQNGRVVDHGKVRVYDSKRVNYSFKPRSSHKGWVALEIVYPKYTRSSRAYYKVVCKANATASAFVSAPANYEGDCPVARQFGGTIKVSGGSATVRYRWSGPGYDGPLESLYFSRDAGAKTVSHTVNASESGTVKRWIEIVGPNTRSSNSASTAVKCKAAAVTASISNLSTAANDVTCGQQSGPAVDVKADITVTGAAKLTYHWIINGQTSSIPTTVELDKAGVHPATFGITPSGTSTIKGNIKLVVTSPSSDTATKDFEYTCPAP